MRAPASRTLAISSAWRGRSRMQTTRSATSACLALARLLQVGRRRLVEVDDALGQAGADRDLVHVDVGRVEEAAGLGHGDDGERVRAALGGDRRAFERIERDVDAAARAGADLLADIEHRRLVALALADHHRAVDGEAVEREAHRVDRGLIGRLLVAAPHQPRGRERRRFGHAHRLEGEVAVHHRRVGHSASPSFSSSSATGHRVHRSSMRIMRGGSSTVSSCPMRSSARRIAASSVTCVVSTTGTASPGDAAALDHRLERHLLVAQARRRCRR